MTSVWGNAFAEAWRRLVEIPLPAAPVFAEREFDEEDGHLVLASFPVVGAVLGVAAWSLVWILDRFLSPAAVAAVSAPIVLVGLEWAVQGRNFIALAKICALLVQRPQRDEDGEREPEELAVAVPLLQTPMGMIIFMGMFLLRGLALAVLIYAGLASWLIVTLVLAAQVQGRLATLPHMDDDRPLVPALANKAAESSWLVACLITIVAGISYFPAVLLAWLVAWGCQRFVANYCQRRFGGINGELVGAAAYATELVIIFTGMLLLVRD